MAPAYCNQTGYLHTADFQRLVLHVISFISIPIHVFGVFCVFFKTPISMQSVKWSMMNVHLFSCLLDLGLSFLTTPFVFFPLMAGYPLGFLEYLGVETEPQVYMIIFMGAYLLVAISIVFENRLFVLVMTNKNLHRYATPIYLIHYIIPLIVIPTVIKIPDQEEGKKNFINLFECVPPYVELKNVFYLILVKKFFLISCGIFIMVLFLEVWFLAYMTDRKLKQQMTKTMSQKTVDLHRKFQRAFILQLLIPFLIVFVPLGYIGFTAIFDYHNQFFNNLTLIIISSHGFFSTIAMVALHAPYREYTLKLFPFFKRLSSSPTNLTAPQSVMVTNM